MIEIPHGAYGRTRSGEKVGPLYHDRFLTTRNGEMFYRDTGENDGSWYSHGRIVDDGSESPLDLIAEWTEGPVRTVTRREIVAGVYERVVVWQGAKDIDGPTDRMGVDFHVTDPSPDELKAAAAVLLELAGALEE